MKELVELYGSYDEIGYQIGKMFSSKIKKIVHERYHTISKEFDNYGIIFNKEEYEKFSTTLIDSLKRYTPNEYNEICGVSEGSNVRVADLIFALGYSDIFDVLFNNALFHKTSECGCTSFVVSGKCNINDKTYAGQTWDMPPGTENYTAFFHKVIDDGNEFYSYSTVLGLTHFGINKTGICIGTTNLSTTETGNGVIFAALIQSALSKKNIDQSLNIIKNIPKVSGHYYYIVAPEQMAYGIEVSASDYHIMSIKNEIYVHANHYKNKKFLKNSINYSPTSENRDKFMKNFLDNNRGNLEIEDYIEILSSHDGQICRHFDMNDKIPSVTCGAIIFNPDDRVVYIKFGHPCEGQWSKYIIDEK